MARLSAQYHKPMSASIDSSKIGQAKESKVTTGDSLRSLALDTSFLGECKELPSEDLQPSILSVAQNYENLHYDI
jgi:hypothetical protein